MARAIRSSTLETRSARLKLPVSIKPTFIRVAKGLGLGYRRNKSGGVWVMRVADGKRSSWVRTIGAADDFAEADGIDALTFWQAQDKVRSLARADRGGTAEPVTVAQALDAYEADLKTRDRDVANVQRIRAHITTGLAGKLITLLAPRELRAWRDDLIQKMSPASVNRTCFSLKAALNLAARQDERVISRRAWQQGLALIPNATNDRNVILADGVVRDLIAEAYNESRELGLFVELAAVTGARPSQIVRLEVRDLQDGCEPRIDDAGVAERQRQQGEVALPCPDLGGSCRTARRAGSAGERAAGLAAERQAVEANEPRLPVPARGESLRSRSGRSDDVRLAA